MSRKNKQRLELTWIGKGQEPKLEPRILIEDTEKSYGDKQTENMLIHGDNLLALKALEQDFTGKIKCIYIDPPYNTGSAFEHYDDGLEHSMWLNLIHARLKILWNLLDKKHGSLWISIDDREMPYLRVILDEICSRSNFVATNVWQKRYSRENREAIGDAHEYIVTYAKNPPLFKSYRNKIPLGKKQLKNYKNPNKDPKGPWQTVSLTAQGYRPNQMYEITAPNGKKHKPPANSCWKVTQPVYENLLKENRIYFGKDGNGVPRRIHYLKNAEGLVPWTWWNHEEVGHTGESKKEIQSLFGDKKVFDTPKPERLIERIIHIATNPGDLVLDSFLGSGTTAAVAHKMNRRWIGVELGDHANTHCLPRLKKVVDGLDEGGITKSTEWRGGGGFKFYNLAPSLLQKDDFGNWVIDQSYNADMLAAAMAKHEGYDYAPSEQLFWKQGQSTEQDFIFTTTQFVTVQLLDKIQEQMQDNESLLICCKSFQEACDGKYANINIKKIPVMLLGRCEFGRDDYSLNIITMPVDEAEEPFVPAARKMEQEKQEAEKNSPGAQQNLFE
ncbi:site-specific DNA-methyltransferase [Phaeodactylibacter xiamenensis]|uniref:site-specific DNA-methyltransferase n=1 Tax=Phaeodactylibacter xiamenensis TaxID=1524460 RepID=UPI0024A812DE|nr:site-specific DNA-methyltransferase [Phaeodactylibacter xiamenensis]